MKILYRRATHADLERLVELEQSCFQQDRISRRSMRQFIGSDHNDLWVAERTLDNRLIGYGLTQRHRGTRLARLYSLAVSDQARGQGVGRQLLEQLERQATEAGRLYMRLEVASHNQSAIRLYQAMGYRVFGAYADYYDDHSDALRMQKRIRTIGSGDGSGSGLLKPVPWYEQTTEFTCGPASLMMAMSALDAGYRPSQQEEIAIWREATTVFMTSGHGGCHPAGLALSARRRGFCSEVWMNTDQPLFLDGVRTDAKKQVMRLVHESFVNECHQASVQIHQVDVGLETIDKWLQSGALVLILISTYRLDGRKAPHWVVVTATDARCFYLHDPDLSEGQMAIDCQHVPLAREDFERMSSYGSSRLRCGVVIWPDSDQSPA